MGRSLGIAAVIAPIVTLSAMGVAVASDSTWKDCELAARDPDSSIAACSKLLKRPSSRAHAAAFHHRGLAFAVKGKLDEVISDPSSYLKLVNQTPWHKRYRRHVGQLASRAVFEKAVNH